MRHIIDKKLFVLGSLLALLVVLPLLIGSLQTTQENRSRASSIPQAYEACGSFTIQDTAVPLGSTPVGAEVWVANYDTSSITRLESNGLQKKSQITLDASVTPITLTTVNDKVWVVGAFDERIYQITFDGEIVNQTIVLPYADTEDPSLPIDALVVGSEVWVTDTTNHKIHRLDFSGNTKNQPIVLPENTFPTTLTRVKDEVWVASGLEESTIHRFSTDGKTIGTPLSDLGLVFDVAGVGDTVWVTHTIDDNTFGIRRYDATGTVIDEITTLQAPVGISLVGEDMWVTEPAADFSSQAKMYVLQTDGTQRLCEQIPPTLSFSLLLHGIGNSGDSTNPNNHEFSNKTPVLVEKPLAILVHAPAGELVSQGFGDVVYNQTEGLYQGNITLDFPIDPGSYTITVITPGYLSKKIADFPLAGAQHASFETLELITGDVNEDNTLDILDYNILYDCGYGSTRLKSTTRSRCFEHYPFDENADLNLDDIVDQKDYNLFLREKPIRHGD